MAAVREGKQGVLMVVDVQVGVLREAWDAARVVGNVAHAVERARARSVPVIWVQHSDDDLPHGSPEWQWVPELVPAAGEPLIHKHFNSSFEQTALEAELARLGATPITLAGFVQELNTAMTWLSYPGRSNGAAQAHEVDFGTPGCVRR